MMMVVYIAYASDNPFLQYKERRNSSRIRAPPYNITISKIREYKSIILGNQHCSRKKLPKAVEYPHTL